MNWAQAVEAMRQGHCVARKSERYIRFVETPHGTVGVMGMEPVRLAAAWTSDDKPALVFQGVQSQELFIPEEPLTSADDWTIVYNDDEQEGSA